MTYNEAIIIEITEFIISFTQYLHKLFEQVVSQVFWVEMAEKECQKFKQCITNRNCGIYKCNTSIPKSLTRIEFSTVSTTFQSTYHKTNPENFAQVPNRQLAFSTSFLSQCLIPLGQSSSLSSFFIAPHSNLQQSYVCTILKLKSIYVLYSQISFLGPSRKQPMHRLCVLRLTLPFIDTKKRV